MPLECLLLTRDDQVIRMLRRVLEDLEIHLEVYTGADKAADEMERRKFDAVMIDCDDVHNAITVLCAVRMTPSNKSSTVFAIVNGITPVSTAIDLGANLALEKPINEPKARHALKALQGLMLQERRRYYRHEVSLAVTMRFENQQKGTHRDVLATAVNLSEGGMAIKVTSALPNFSRTPTVKFVMPGSHDWVEVEGTVAWADERGNAGVRFENVPSTLKERFIRYFREVERDDQDGPVKKRW